MNFDFSVLGSFSWWRFILFLVACLLGVVVWRLPEILNALGA